MGIFRQILYTGIASYTCMCIGITFTWPSCTFRLFTSNETVLHRPMTETEISLFGSLSSIGALISVPIMGFLLDKVGRKFCALASVLMYVISWGMIAASSQVEVILTAVFISGIGGAATFVVPVLIVEICQENIRGTMTTGGVIFYTVGTLISYVIGGTLSYKTMVYVCLTLSVVGATLLTTIRETPMFLMMKGLEEEAAKSFAFYRNAKVDSKEVMNEMDKLRRAFNPQFDENSFLTMFSLIVRVSVSMMRFRKTLWYVARAEDWARDLTRSLYYRWKYHLYKILRRNHVETPVHPEEQKLNPEEKPAPSAITTPTEKLSTLQFIRKSRSTRRAAFVTLTLVTASIFQGLIVLQVYAEPLFTEATPNLSATVACVIFSIVTIISGAITAYLTDVAGRRNLMIYSSVASGLCCVVLGSQLHIHWAPHWVTALFIYMFTAAYTFGAGTVPYLLIAEVFLPDVKCFMSMLVMEWAWLCSFIILFIFNPLVLAIGLGPTFYLFATICFLSAAFSAIYQPETKGLCVDAIQALFLGKRV